MKEWPSFDLNNNLSVLVNPCATALEVVAREKPSIFEGGFSHVPVGCCRRRLPTPGFIVPRSFRSPYIFEHDVTGSINQPESCRHVEGLHDRTSKQRATSFFQLPPS